MERRNPLFFRTDGALDFGPFLLAVVSAVGVLLLLCDAFGMARVSVAAWAFLGSFCALAFIAGAAAERAYWISQSRTPGDIARGIATATPPHPGMDANERGDD